MMNDEKKRFFFRSKLDHMKFKIFKCAHFWKLKLDFLPHKKVFCLTTNRGTFNYYYLIMNEVSRNLRNIFFSSSSSSSFIHSDRGRLGCTRLWHRTCKTSRGTSLRSWFKCTRLWHRTCKTSQGTSLRSWFQKKCLLPMGIVIFYLTKNPHFQKKVVFRKRKVGFFSNKKVFRLMAKKGKFLILN